MFQEVPFPQCFLEAKTCGFDEAEISSPYSYTISNLTDWLLVSNLQAFLLINSSPEASKESGSAALPERNEPHCGMVNIHLLADNPDKLDYAGWIGCQYVAKVDTVKGMSWGKRYNLGGN